MVSLSSIWIWALILVLVTFAFNFLRFLKVSSDPQRVGRITEHVAGYALGALSVTIAATLNAYFP